MRFAAAFSLGNQDNIKCGRDGQAPQFASLHLNGTICNQAELGDLT
jgi:hypothetical protein